MVAQAPRHVVASRTTARSGAAIALEYVNEASVRPNRSRVTGPLGCVGPSAEFEHDAARHAAATRPRRRGNIVSSLQETGARTARAPIVPKTNSVTATASPAATGTDQAG